MSYYIVIRGPAGVGKTEVARKLVVSLRGVHIPFDDVMKEHGLDRIEGDGISPENFIQANQLVIPEARKALEKNKVVIFDGCFYRREQLEHLEKSLPFRHWIFSLEATLEDCLSRNRSRKGGMKDKDIEDVFNLVSKTGAGMPVSTSGKTVSEVTEEIMNRVLG